MILEHDNGHWYVATLQPIYTRLTGPLDWSAAIRYAVEHSHGERLLSIQNGRDSLDWNELKWSDFQHQITG